MTDTLINFDIAAVDWARAQFALTAIYHWLFVPLTLGLAVIMGIAETLYYVKKDDFWKETAKFWQRLFGVNFAIGVATGIILEFQFGTNWSNYSWFVGDIFGAPLAIEGIVAFFMESTFVAVMFFGWTKVSRGFHLASTWLTGLGATISAWWILVANAWMQYPTGCEFNPDTMRNEMTSFLSVALSPVGVDKFLHTITSAWIIGALFVTAVSGWYLLKKRHERLAIESIKISSAVGLVATLLAVHTGDTSAYMVSKVQPMKLAAMAAIVNAMQSTTDHNGAMPRVNRTLIAPAPISVPREYPPWKPDMRCLLVFRSMAMPLTFAATSIVIVHAPNTSSMQPVSHRSASRLMARSAATISNPDTCTTFFAPNLLTESPANGRAHIEPSPLQSMRSPNVPSSIAKAFLT